MPFDFTKRDDLSNDEFFYENQTMNGFGYAYDTIYNGKVSNYSRFDVDAVKTLLPYLKLRLLRRRGS